MKLKVYVRRSESITYRSEPILTFLALLGTVYGKYYLRKSLCAERADIITYVLFFN